MKKLPIVGQFTLPNGKTVPVVEPKNGIATNLKQEHIDKGIPGDAKNCPLALAGGAGFWIYRHILYVESYDDSHGDVLARMRADQRTSKFIDNFDNGRPVKPGIYRFLPVSHSRSLITKRQYNEKWRPQHRMRAIIGTRLTKKHNKTNSKTRSGCGYVKFISKKKGY